MSEQVFGRGSDGWVPRDLLEGVRVVDFARNIAGAYITRVMGDLGAEVLKIEPPHLGDPIRWGGWVPKYSQVGLGNFFPQSNCSKKGLSLDLKQPEAREIVYELVKVSDVVTNNFVPGTMERLGFGYETLAGVNPSIIYCSVSAFGQYGPYRERRGTEPVIEASSGFMGQTGDPDGPPQLGGHSVCDFITALTGFGGICAALYYRGLTGRGQSFDLAMHDASVASNDIPLSAYLQGGVLNDPHRRGHRRPDRGLYGNFRGRDGWVFISGSSEDSFQELCHIIGRPDLLAPEAFGSAEAWQDPDRNAVVFDIVDQWVKSFESVREVEEKFHGTRVLASRVVSIQDLANEENTRARSLIATLPDPRVGELKVQNTAFKLSLTPGRVRSAPPRIGEHNKEVLEQLLGYTPRQIAELFLSEVIWAEPQLQEEILKSL